MSSQVVLITGASTGLGRDTAETLGRAGHAVFASMRDVVGKNRGHAERRASWPRPRARGSRRSSST